MRVHVECSECGKGVSFEPASRARGAVDAEAEAILVGMGCVHAIARRDQAVESRRDGPRAQFDPFKLLRGR